MALLSEPYHHLLFYFEMVLNPACLIVIDGWGISPKTDHLGDAIFNANTPVMDKLTKDYPSMSVAAHGLSVGLPEGLMGNSEVGHLNVGAGRIVYQDIVRIEKQIKNKELLKNENLVASLKNAVNGNGRLHFLGLISDGGVHSMNTHLYAFLESAKEMKVPKVFIHFFADGRDTAPTSTSTYLKQLLDKLNNKDSFTFNAGKLASITGRYYAMDRDKRWERIEVAYDALVSGIGEVSNDPVESVEKRYKSNETDEFLKPIIVDKEGMIQDNDTLVFFNYRADRMREITQVFGKIGGSYPFSVKTERKNLHITTMTEYNAVYPFPVLFPKQSMDNVLGEWLSKKNINQMHIAETEKYAHVTFFFNGGTEKQFPLEERVLVPSPKVATYDLKPEMSVSEVCKEVASAIRSGKYPFVMCNIASPDMVGHTGVYEATILGVEACDKGIGVIFEACLEKNCN
jgi:2,3-bisphosphoglycerate-independent phosphoglycerate mutase